MPIQQSVQDIEVRPRTYTMVDAQGEGNQENRRDAIEVQSINGTTFRVDVAVQYSIEAENASTFVEEWNNVNQVERRLIRQTVRSSIRDVGGSIQSSNIFTSSGREQLESAATESLRQRFSDEPLVLENVYIRNVAIPDAYQESLNQKEIAKQEVQREQQRVRQQELQAQRQLIRARANAQERLIGANATARSNYIVSQSLNSEVLAYLYTQSLDRSNTVYIPMGEGGLPTYLNVQTNGTGINESAIPSGVGGGDFSLDTNTSVNASTP
jgi:regulator of protease activity HflC (stomatin/prohibitin superfamily)